MTLQPTGSAGSEVEPFDPATSRFPVLFDSGETGGFAELVRDNFGDEGFSIADLDRIHVPTSGGTYWEIPDEPPRDAIEGVIVYWGVSRSFWEHNLNDPGAEQGPPDCASGDGRIGNGKFGPGSQGNPTGECAECPMNAWGSGVGDAKACKEQRQLWMLLPDAVLPIQVSLPPTSLKDFRKYMTRLTGSKLPYYGVVTRLGLEKVKYGVNAVAVVKPSRTAILAPQERDAAGVYGQTIKNFLATSRSDVEGSAAKPADDPFEDEMPVPDEYADEE